MKEKRTPDGRLILVEWWELVSRRERWPVSPMFESRAQAEDALELMRGQVPDLEIVPGYRCFDPGSALHRAAAQQLRGRIIPAGCRR